MTSRVPFWLTMQKLSLDTALLLLRALLQNQAECGNSVENTSALTIKKDTITAKLNVPKLNAAALERNGSEEQERSNRNITVKLNRGGGGSSSHEIADPPTRIIRPASESLKELKSCPRAQVIDEGSDPGEPRADSEPRVDKDLLRHLIVVFAQRCASTMAGSNPHSLQLIALQTIETAIAQGYAIIDEPHVRSFIHFIVFVCKQAKLADFFNTSMAAVCIVVGMKADQC